MKEPYLLVLASDHLIKDIRKFRLQFKKVLNMLIRKACDFGIVPDYPETGYGYIETDVEYSLNDFKGISIKKFIEKPNREKARIY